MFKKRTHRVGTITLGITLIIFGAAYLMHLFFPTLSYYNIMKAWPIILILLGIEVILTAVKTPDDTPQPQYDKAAVFLIAMLILFTICIGCLSVAIERTGYLSL